MRIRHLSSSSSRSSSRAKTAGLLLIIIAAFAATGCQSLGITYGDTAPTYRTAVIESFAEAAPRTLWQRSKTARAARPEPVPAHLTGIEPPLVVELTELDEETLLAIEPLEMAYLAPKAGMYTFETELPARAKVVAIDKATGEDRWSQTLTATGIYNVVSTAPVLLISVDEYDATSWRLSATTLFALDVRSGDLLWSRRSGDRYSSIVTAPEARRLLLTSMVDTTETPRSTSTLVDLETGQTAAAWTTEGAMPGPEPFLIGTRVITFEAGVTCRELSNGSTCWDRGDLISTSTASPETDDGVLFVAADTALVALDLKTGATAWRTATLNGFVSGITSAAGTVFVRTHGLDLDRAEHEVLAVDPSDGAIRWTHSESGYGAGNMTTDGGTLYYTTWERLIALDASSGSLRFQVPIPWENRMAPHQVRLVGDLVTVVSEWHAAAWSSSDGAPSYHHAFEPLWPAVTTQVRQEDEAVILGQGNKDDRTLAVLNDLASISAQNHARTMNMFDRRIGRYDRQWRNYGDRSALSMKSGLLATQASFEEAQASLERAQAMLTFTYALADVAETVVWAQLHHIHSTNYPLVDREIARLRAQDTPEFVVRLTSAEEDGQRFIATEILELATGGVRRQLLSPFQSPDLFTVASKWGSVRSGYLRVASLLNHNFRTVIDVDGGRVFHCGPGLDTSSYEYTEEGFARGRLVALPLVR